MNRISKQLLKIANEIQNNYSIDEILDSFKGTLDLLNQSGQSDLGTFEMIVTDKDYSTSMVKFDIKALYDSFEYADDINSMKIRGFFKVVESGENIVVTLGLIQGYRKIGQCTKTIKNDHLVYESENSCTGYAFSDADLIFGQNSQFVKFIEKKLDEQNIIAMNQYTVDKQEEQNFEV